MKPDPPPVIFTIGHGTRSLEELVSTLRASGVHRLFDVRRFPGSRHNPQFGRDNLAAALPLLGIDYVFRGEELGGRRHSKKGVSRHPALENDSFRAYADYMDTEPFEAALERLVDEAKTGKLLAIMCAETPWQKCHRRLVSDALVLRGVPVVHLLSPSRTEPHVLTRGARPDERGRPVYDVGSTAELFAAPRSR